MKKILKSMFLLLSAGCFAATSWAAEPIATWTFEDGEVVASEGAPTLDLGTNSVTGDFVQIGTSGLTVTGLDITKWTIVVDIENAPTTGMVLDAKLNNNNYIGLYSTNSNLKHRWTNNLSWGTAKDAWSPASRQIVTMSYRYAEISGESTHGTATYLNGTLAARANGLRTSANLASFVIGYVAQNRSEANLLATNMKVHSIRLYDTQLSDAEAPSSLQSFTPYAKYSPVYTAKTLSTNKQFHETVFTRMTDGAEVNGNSSNNWRVFASQIKNNGVYGDCAQFGQTGATLRLTTAAESTHVFNADFGPLSLTGLIVEAGATGYSFENTNTGSDSRRCEFGNRINQNATSYFTLHENFTFKRSDTHVFGPCVFEIDEGKTLTINHSHHTRPVIVKENATLTIKNGGTMAISGGLTFENNTALDVTGGTLSATGTVTFGSTVTVNVATALGEDDEITLITAPTANATLPTVVNVTINGVAAEGNYAIAPNANANAFVLKKVDVLTWTPTAENQNWDDTTLWSTGTVATEGNIVVDFTVLTETLALELPAGTWGKVTLIGGASNAAGVTLAEGATVAQFILAGNVTLPASIVATASVTLDAANTLTIDATEDATFENALTFDGALVKTGNGTLTVNAALTAAHGITINAGTIAGTGTINSALTYASSATSTFGGILAGANNVTITNGTLALTGKSTLNGATCVTIEAGAMLDISDEDARLFTNANNGVGNGNDAAKLVVKGTLKTRNWLCDAGATGSLGKLYRYANLVKVDGGTLWFTASHGTSEPRGVTFTSAPATIKLEEGVTLTHSNNEVGAYTGTGDSINLTLTGNGTFDNKVAFQKPVVLTVSEGTTLTGNTALNANATVTFKANAKLGADVVCPATATLEGDLICASEDVATAVAAKLTTAPDGYEFTAEGATIKLALAQVTITLPEAPANTTWWYDGEEVTGNTVTVDPNQNITLTLKAKGDYLFADEDSEKSITVTVVDSNVTLTEEDLPDTEIVAAQAKCKASGKLYKTLQDALNRVDTYGEVVLLMDVVTNTPIEVTKSLVIEGNEKTLTYTGDNRAITVENTFADASLTIKDLTIACTNSECQRGVNYNTTESLILDNVTITGNALYAVSLPGSSDGAEVIISNSSITGRIALNIWGEGMTITVENSDLTSVDDATDEDYVAIKLNKNAETAAEGTEVTVTGGTITAKNEKNEPSYVVENSTDTATVDISDTTTVNGMIVETVAIVTFEGTDQYYACDSLEDAIDGAKNGGTITLLKNVTVADLTQPVTIPEKAVLDLNGKTAKGTILGTIAVNGGTYVTAQDIAVIGTNAVTYESADAIFTMDDVAGNISLDSGTITAKNQDGQGNNWTLRDQTLTIKSGVTLNVPAEVTMQVNGTSITIENGATLNIAGKINLYSADATITAPAGLNVTTTVAGCEVAYVEGVYRVITIPEEIYTSTNIPDEVKQALVEAMADAGVTEIKSYTITTGKAEDDDDADAEAVAAVLEVFEEVTPEVDANGTLSVAYEFGISNITSYITDEGDGKVAKVTITAGVTGAKYRAGVAVAFYADGVEIGTVTTTAEGTKVSITDISAADISGKDITVKASK